MGDLRDWESVEKALEGATYVIHTASPIPTVDTEDEEKEIIIPA